jgi:flagellar hook protein FlgE
MSLTGAIDIGLSGLDAFSKGLQTVSNNVANLNTSGYKQLTTGFTDLFDENGSQTDGNGVQVAPAQIDFSQGTLQQTGGALDLAIQGNGFLVLSNGSNYVYARTGSFSVDSKGYISEQGTLYQLCVLNASGQAVPVNVNNLQTLAPTATTSVTFQNNLSSGATSDTISGVTVYDSTGAKHTWQVALAPNSSKSGTWDVTVTDETGATVGTGTIAFSGSAIDPTSAKVTVSTTYSGASPLSVALDFSGVTYYSTGTTSTLQVNTADGSATGTLTGVTINSSGQVQLNYSNSQNKIEGSVAMASFIDPQQLHEASNGVFENLNGAHALVSSSGQGGVGTLVSGQIEGSNVNLTQEFGDLILIQRGYQASSEAVSVGNDMIQELFSMRGQG